MHTKEAVTSFDNVFSVKTVAFVYLFVSNDILDPGTFFLIPSLCKYLNDLNISNDILNIPGSRKNIKFYHCENTQLLHIQIKETIS